jgi:hypothetical protein
MKEVISAIIQGIACSIKPSKTDREKIRIKAIGLLLRIANAFLDFGSSLARLSMPGASNWMGELEQSSHMSSDNSRKKQIN